MTTITESGNDIVITTDGKSWSYPKDAVSTRLQGNQYFALSYQDKEVFRVSQSELNQISNPVSANLSALQGFVSGFLSTSSSSLLPVDSSIVWVGDSITAHQFNVINGNYYYLADGYATHANIVSGHRYFQPIGGNKGIAGENTDQIIARLGSILALKPKMMVIMAGTNDIPAGKTSASIKGNLQLLYNAAKSIGSKVLAITIPPRFAPATLLTAPQEATRLDVNAWILANKDIDSAIDSAILNNASYFGDGLHPNVTGDFMLGSTVGSALNKFIEKYSAAYQIHPESINNFTLSGSVTSNGYTVPTSWTVQNGFLGGATIVGSKGSDNGLNQQIFTFSGNYTGNGRGFNFSQDYTTSYYKEGDVIESILDMEISSALLNVSRVAPVVTIFTAGFSATIALTEAYFPTNTDSFPYGIGRYTIKSPAIKIGAGTPAIINTQVSFLFKDAAVSSPVSGQIKIHRVGSRRIV